MDDSAICPYCENRIKFKDVKTANLFGINPADSFRNRLGAILKNLRNTKSNFTRMFICPKCDKILGFSI